MAWAPPTGGFSWERALEAIRRHRWFVLAVVLVGSGLGFLFARELRPQYAVQSTIWFSDSNREGTGSPILAAELLDSHAWVELLNSYAVLDEVVRRLRLHAVPKAPGDSAVLAGLEPTNDVRPGEYRLRTDRSGERYVLETAEGEEVESGAVGSPVGRTVGLDWTPSPGVLGPDRAVEFRVASPREASKGLRNRLDAQMAPDGSFLRLTLEGDSPHRLAMTMNVLTEEFVEVATDLKKRKLSELAKVLEGQLEYAETRLRSAEESFEGFRSNSIALPDEGADGAGGAVRDSYFEQQLDLEDVRRQRALLEQTIRGVRRGEASVDAFYAIPAVQTAPELRAGLEELAQKEAELRALRYRYTDEYPPIQNLERAVTSLRGRTIPKLAGALVDRLRVQERSLAGRVASASRELQAIPTRTIEESRLRRNVEIANNLYSNLQSRYEEARLAEASAIPDLRVLDSAVAPEYPNQDDAPRIILLAFLASLGVGLAGALVLDRKDRRFRYPEQATNELGLSILGVVPHIGKGVADGEDAEHAMEALRGIRINLEYAHGAARPLLLAITSPSAGDGKSLVTSNLALSFAEAGYRTLLVDGDTRRGGMHRLFSVQRQPGLTDHLAGTAGAEDIVRPTRHPNLSLIPCGSWNSRGPELLGSAEMMSLLGDMKSRFEVILFDTPPLSAGVDPLILATAAGSLALVLRVGETDRKLAEAKLASLDRLPVRLLGAVLNDIEPKGTYQYYAYDSGYSEESREKPFLLLPEGKEAGTRTAARTSVVGRLAAAVPAAAVRAKALAISVWAAAVLSWRASELHLLAGYLAKEVGEGLRAARARGFSLAAGALRETRETLGPMLVSAARRLRGPDVPGVPAFPCGYDRRPGSWFRAVVRYGTGKGRS